MVGLAWHSDERAREFFGLYNGNFYVYILVSDYTLEHRMRTNVVIDDDLMESALKATQMKTKKSVIEEGLRLLILMKNQEKIKEFRGKLHWIGNLEKMRSDA